MEVLVRAALGALLVAHGLVHLMWFARNDDPAWPFRLDRSSLMPEATRKPVAITLVALVVAARAPRTGRLGSTGSRCDLAGAGHRGRRGVTRRPGAVLGSSARVGRGDQ